MEQNDCTKQAVKLRVRGLHNKVAYCGLPLNVSKNYKNFHCALIQRTELHWKPSFSFYHGSGPALNIQANNVRLCLWGKSRLMNFSL